MTALIKRCGGVFAVLLLAAATLVAAPEFANAQQAGQVPGNSLGAASDSEMWRAVRQGRDGFHLAPALYDGSETVPIDVTSFVGFFISRKGLSLAGLPDAGLFLYGDDGLYTLGLSAAGGRIGFDPTIRSDDSCSSFSVALRGRFRALLYFY